MLKHTLKNKHSVECVAISDDSKLIASGCYDGTIRVWCAQTGNLMFTMKGREHAAMGIDFMGQNTLITCGLSHSIKVWALHNEKDPALQHKISEASHHQGIS
jgi:WD40 repeat protein